MDDNTPQNPTGPDPEAAPGPPGQPAEPTASGTPEPAAAEPTRQMPAAEPTQPMAAASSPPGSGGGAGSGQPVGWSPIAGPPVAPRRSFWRDAVSTTGGKIATITAIVAVAVVGLLVLGLVIGAITRQARFERTVAPLQDHRSAPKVPRDRGPMGGMPGLRGNGGDNEAPGLGLGLGRIQHGDFTVTDITGKARTLTFQRGEVTAASSTSVTVRSSDGFTATYKIDSATRLRAQGSPLATGQTVVVLADKDTTAALRVQRGGVVG